MNRLCYSLNNQDAVNVIEKWEEEQTKIKFTLKETCQFKYHKNFNGVVEGKIRHAFLHKNGDISIGSERHITFSLSQVAIIHYNEKPVQISSFPSLMRLCCQTILKKSIDYSKLPRELREMISKIKIVEELIPRKNALVRPADPHKEDNAKYFSQLAQLLDLGLPHSAIEIEDLIGAFCALGHLYIKQEDEGKALSSYKMLEKINPGIIPNSVRLNFFTLQLIQKGYLIADQNLIVYLFKNVYDHLSYVDSSIKENYEKLLFQKFLGKIENDEKIDFDIFFTQLAHIFHFKQDLADQINLLNKIPFDYLLPVLCRLAKNLMEKEDKEKTLIFYRLIKRIQGIYNSYEKNLLTLNLIHKEWVIDDGRLFLKKQKKLNHSASFKRAGNHIKKISAEEIAETQHLINELAKKFKVEPIQFPKKK